MVLNRWLWKSETDIPLTIYGYMMKRICIKHNHSSECLTIRIRKHIFHVRLEFSMKSTRPCYEDMLNNQIDEVIKKKGKGNLNKLLKGRETWTIKA